MLTPLEWFLLGSGVKAVLAILALLFLVAYTVVAERRISAWIQDRVGPNRVGPWGLLQPMADGVKVFLKEDYVPAPVRKAYYWLAPGLVMLPAMLTLAVIPFGSRLSHQGMVIADLNVGILYVFGVAPLTVYGLLLAGYAARSKYPFLGGLRAGAQLISYSVVMGLALVPVVLLVGDLNLSRIVAYQAASGSHWLIFRAPVSFVLFIVAAFAETNRTPFDLPEAEHELVGGYNTEYGALKFALFFMGEYANLIAISTLTVTLFLGGWTLPWLGLNHPASNLGVGLFHIGLFLGKTVAIVGAVLWVRWMLPRFRFDQLMDLGWRRLIPAGLANLLGYAWVLWMRV